MPKPKSRPTARASIPQTCSFTTRTGCFAPTSLPYSAPPMSCYDASEARLLQQWQGLWRTGNDLVRDILGERDRLQATKAYTELVLTPEFNLGAIWNRAYSKPLGDPGGFEVMNYVYSWQRTGADPYAMLIHRLGLECAA